MEPKNDAPVDWIGKFRTTAYVFTNNFPINFSSVLHDSGVNQKKKWCQN